MKRAVGVLSVTLLVLSVAVMAQAPPAPKPVPELKRLNYFVGTWNTEGESKPGPWGPGGKFTSIDKTGWMKGNFFLLSLVNNKSSMGEIEEHAIMGYDADAKKYTYHAFNSNGDTVAAKGTVASDTWTWLSEIKMGTTVLKSRFVVKEVSPTSYTFKYETSQDGKKWDTVAEGKSTKAAAK